MNNTGWFADVNPKADNSLTDYVWQPCIQTDIGCFDIEVWFNSKEACEYFIRDHLLGKGLLDD